MAKKITRIGIGGPNSAKSMLWSVVIDGSDVYIAQRFAFETAKISLHDSGKWRFAVNSQNWTKSEDRALCKWNRPNPTMKTVVLGPTIVFPPVLAKQPLVIPDQYNKKIEWLTAPTNNQERVLMVTFSLGKKHMQEHLNKVNLKPDYFTSLPIKGNSRLHADTVHIISWLEPMRPFTKSQVDDVLAKMKIHYKNGSSPDGVFGVATPLYTPSEEEKSRGLSPTIIEIILGNENLEEDKKSS